MIEFPKTINLIESRMNDLSKFRTKNWVEKKKKYVKRITQRVKLSLKLQC